MRFESLPLREANLAELAKASYDARHGTMLSNKARTASEVEKRLKNIVGKGTECMIIEARDESHGTLNGFLELFMIIPCIVQTGQWQPIVPVSNTQCKIARRLIEEAKSYAGKTGRGRLEALFDEITPKHRPLLRKYGKWYSSEGFEKVSEEFRMRSTITEIAPQHRELSRDFSLLSAAAVNKDEVRNCYLRSFWESMDKLILSMKPEQRRNTF